MRDDVVLRFIIVDHRRQYRLVIGCFPHCPRKFQRVQNRFAFTVTRKLDRRIVGPVAEVIAVRQAAVCRHQLRKEVFMIASDEDHLIAFHQAEDKILQFQSLASPVKEVSGDHQLVRLRVLKVSRSRQGVPKRRIKAVDIRCYIVFQDDSSPLSCLLALYHILLNFDTAVQRHEDLFL